MAKPILQKIAETTGLNELPQKPRYDIEGRYQALLEAGETLLCEDYDQAQPKRIAKAAGVSVGLFYKHFSSKRELLAAVMVHRLGILHQLIEEALATQSSSERSLEVVIAQTLTYFQKHQGLAKLFFMQIGYGDEQAVEQLAEARANYRRILRSVIECGIEQQHFVSMNSLELETLVSSIVGTINWTMYEGLVAKEIDPQTVTDRLVALFLRGIRLERGR